MRFSAVSTLAAALLYTTVVASTGAFAAGNAAASAASGEKSGQTECGKNTATGEEQCILIQQAAPLRQGPVVDGNSARALPASPEDAAAIRKLQQMRAAEEKAKKEAGANGAAEEEEGPGLWQ